MNEFIGVVYVCVLVGLVIGLIAWYVEAVHDINTLEIIPEEPTTIEKAVGVLACVFMILTVLLL